MLIWELQLAVKHYNKGLHIHQKSGTGLAKFMPTAARIKTPRFGRRKECHSSF
jgi:hypothetical protein